MSKYVTQTAVPGGRRAAAAARKARCAAFTAGRLVCNCKQFDQTGKLTTFCVIISKITHIGPETAFNNHKS